MQKFTKKDLFFSVITGLITGFIAWRIFVFLNLSVISIRNIFNSSSCKTPTGMVVTGLYCPPNLISISASWFLFIVPILWILGVNLGYFLGRWLAFFNQFGKFAAIGFTNAAVYFGLLNVLIAWTDINKGVWYSIFVAVAFVAGATHSYFWNKFWVFEATLDGVSGGEFGKFFGVSLIAGLINVVTASLVVNIIGPMFGLTPDQWANIGGVAGSAVALVFSFIGFKVAVFNK